MLSPACVLFILFVCPPSFAVLFLGIVEPSHSFSQSKNAKLKQQAARSRCMRPQQMPCLKVFPLSGDRCTRHYSAILIVATSVRPVLIIAKSRSMLGCLPGFLRIAVANKSADSAEICWQTNVCEFASIGVVPVNNHIICTRTCLFSQPPCW